MKQLLHLLTIFVLGLFAAISSSAAPLNDNFANAITLTGPIVTTTGSNVGATKQFGAEPFVAANFGGASVWWVWTASASGQTTIDTSGSSFNTLLGVYTGNAQNALALIGDNNDYNGNTWSRVQFNAVAGTTYRILVDGFAAGGFPPQAAQGSIVLHIQGVGGLSIDSPTNGMVLTLGTPVPIAVSISTNFPNPPATRVDFYAQGSLVGSQSNAPFSLVASNFPAGSNSVYVIAFDSLGNPIQSPVVNFLVQNVGVTLLTPGQDNFFLNTNPIALTTWTYLPSGAITNIDFFVDGQKFAASATPPFSATWSNVVGGSHRLTAIGKSDAGVSYNSQPVNIGVATLLVHSNAVWKYLDNGSDQGTNWTLPSFDDSSWASGPAELGYGDGDEATVVHSGPTNNFYITTYFRRSFVASNVAGLANLFVLLSYDDAGAVYLNGKEIYRTANLPTNQNYLTVASGAAIEETVDAALVSAASLVEGINEIAVEIHQQAGNSSDISFFLQLSGIPLIIHNLSPVVTLVTPTNNQYFLAPSSIPLQAMASDADGSVAKVEFYSDGVKVAETTNADFTASWSNPALGPHSVTAVAIDDLGARTESAVAFILIYDAIGTPYVQITAPLDGTAVEGGTNQVINVFAIAAAGVTNVQFLSNGGVIGNDASLPYSLLWDAPFGTNALTAIASDVNGLKGTSTVVRLIAFPNTIAPTLVSRIPAGGATLTNLTNITVTFSERVQNVDASDLLLNGIPATGVSGSGSNYVFTFPQPPYGSVAITWVVGHGITDFGYPANLSFDALGAGAQWSYTLIDKTPPTIAARVPAVGATVTNLSQISVTFSESVSGVDAGDLLVNGTPAASVSGSGTSYVFNVNQPAPGTVNITWTTTNGILDLAASPNAFVASSGAWSFTLDTRVVLVQSNSNWRFVKGFAEASSPMSAWRQPEFDDSSWSNSQAPFYFGDPYTNFPAGIYGTLLSDMLSNYTTIYLREAFVVQNRGAITNLLINHQSDDGFVAWLNGVEVFRYNVPTGELAFTATASTAANEPNNTGAAYIVATLTNGAVSRLVNGTNILAIQALNQSLNGSSDFGFNAQVYYQPVDPSAVAPRLVSFVPAAGDLFYFTNVTISFSEGVSGVDAGDLLVNGVPASSVSSTTNATYTFSFLQPAYGPVALTWATNHGIADFDSPPKAFDGTAASATASYTLLNPSSPRVVTQVPLAGTTITGLTSITITFTEPVTGVDASDLLVSGVPASGVTTSDGISYRFSFPQPAFGTATIRWAANHAITDFEVPPAAFDPTRFGGQWNYTLIDPVPSVTLTSPTNNTFVLAPATALLRATATDNDGTVAEVDFLANGVNVGAVTNSPYSMTLSNLGQGAYTFRAVAIDNGGLVRTSAPVVLNVVTSLPTVLVRGPYLQIGSPTGAVVRWRSDLFSDAVVYYGTDAANLTNYAAQRVQTNEHIVAIGGLQPDTKYYYSVGNAAQRLAGTNGPGSDYWFKTSPPVGSTKPTRLWIVGDSGTAGNGPADRVNSVRDSFYNLAASNGPADLFLMLGDNAYNSGLDTEYQAAVFDVFPTLLRNTFVWPTIGNHESNQSTTSEDYPYLNIFSLPHNGEAGGLPSGTQKYYSFNYANIHFLCIDSMTSGYNTNSAMLQWVKDDLSASTAEFIIAFFHHPPYTHGTHNSDIESDLIQIRQNFIPVLEDYGVDLVLNGHSHVHERSFLLDRHYGVATTFSETNKIDGGSGRTEETGAYRKDAAGRGVVYNVCGSSGQALGGTLDHPAHFLSLNELGSLVIDVSKGRLDARFLTTNGSFSDHYTIVKEPLPAVPANLIVRALGGSSVSLNWADLATNELGFVLERSIDGVDFTRFTTNGMGITYAVDSGLAANTTYFYRVRSYNVGGESAPSPAASATTVMATGMPATPSGLAASASAGNEAYRSQMVLRWRDNSGNEAGFLIERSTDGTAFSPVGTVGANANSYLDRNLASATPYYYRVRSFNPVGDSAPSNLDGDQTHPQDNVVGIGDTATFHGGVEGTPPVRYQWRFLDTPISGATNEAFTVVNAQTTNEGPYTVVVTDASGSRVSNAAWLFVAAPPVIVEQPAGRTNVTGSVATFHVTATGTTPMFYQWRKNGVLLNGAGSDQFTVSSISLADQANYDVIVANNLGAITSQVARLVVNFPPVAGTDHMDTFRNQAASVSAATLLGNDSDPDGDALSVTGVNAASANGGAVSLAAGTVTYSPPAGFAGDDSFTYTLTDSRGGSSPGIVTVYVSGNTAPVMAVLPTLAANVLTPLVLGNLATDAQGNKLTYSLVASSVTNAFIDTYAGAFMWTPTRAQARTTNTFTVSATDDGRPPLSNSVTFVVVVNDYVELTAPSLIFNAGDSTNVPVDFFSSGGLLGLQCALQISPARLTNVAVDALAPQIAAVSFQMQDSNTAALTFTAVPGQTLQGTQHLARLRFTAITNQTSGFMPLRVTSLSVSPSGAGAAPTLLANDGRLTIIGAQPMLEQAPAVSGQRAVILYGKKGSSYNIEYSTNLATWTLRGATTLTTNVFRSVTLGNTPVPPVFYRVRQ